MPGLQPTVGWGPGLGRGTGAAVLARGSRPRASGGGTRWSRPLTRLKPSARENRLNSKFETDREFVVLSSKEKKIKAPKDPTRYRKTYRFICGICGAHPSSGFTSPFYSGGCPSANALGQQGGSETGSFAATSPGLAPFRGQAIL